MKYENLILVHSFPTNSILLKGLIDFLNDHFNLYFIDLPGFTRESPPIQQITINSYSAYVEKYINNLKIDHYILGGISFGFLIVNNIKIDKRCKVILAMEPFLGLRSLHMGPVYRAVLRSVARVFVSFGLSKKIWHSKHFRARMLRRGEPEQRVETLLREVDPRTYFETACLLLKYNEDIVWHGIPYILIVNPYDKTINAENITKIFKTNVKKLLVIKTTIDHYPKEPTKKYFADRINSDQIESMLIFIKNFEIKE